MAEEKKVKRLKKERGKEAREREGSEDDLEVEEGKRAVTYQVNTRVQIIKEMLRHHFLLSVIRFLVTEV